jgi:hypothetical protein
MCIDQHFAMIVLKLALALPCGRVFKLVPFTHHLAPAHERINLTPYLFIGNFVRFFTI